VGPVLKYSNWLVTAILLFVGTRVLFVILRGVLTPDSLWRERAVASLVQATVAVLFILAAVGTVRWKAWGRSIGIAICVWNAFATIFLSPLARSETQSYGAEFLCSLGASGYLVPSAYGQTSIPSARCGATQPAAKSWVVTVHQVVLGDSTALLHASRLANIRDRYDPTVPAYVLRHRRTCGIFNPNANPRFVRLLRIIKYLAVARSLVSCCKYLLFPLCHGNDLRLPPQLRENVDIRQTPGYMSSF